MKRPINWLYYSTLTQVKKGYVVAWKSSVLESWLQKWSYEFDPWMHNKDVDNGSGQGQHWPVLLNLHGDRTDTSGMKRQEWLTLNVKLFPILP